MKVTAAYVRKLEKGKFYGKADVVFDGILTIKGFTVFSRDDGSFNVAPPATLGKGKDKDTGQVVDKWWDNIWIKKDTEEGEKLLAEINEKVILSIRKENHADQRTDKVLKETEEDLLGDDDGDLF